MLQKISTFLHIFIISNFIFLTFTLTDSEKQQKLAKFKNSMQTKTKLIASELQKEYQKNCTQSLLQCSQKTYNLCEGTATRQCLYNFPPLSGCLNSGIVLSKISGVRVPNIFQINSLNDDTRRFVCASAMIEDTFLSIFQTNNQQYSYAYIGSSSGAIRLSPSFKQDIGMDMKCADFDSRIRPWYVSTITGPKNIIILFDISKTMESMFPGSRFLNAKITLKIILTTLNSKDNVAVILFSSTARNLLYKKVVAVTDDTRSALISSIDSISTQDGSTNYTAAVELGVQMRNQFSGTNCSSTFFLLLTDGYTENDDVDGYLSIPDYIDQYLVGNVLLISFVFGAESNIKYTYVEKATYFYDGILFRIVDGVDKITMIDKLTNFYSFLSEGFPSRKTVTWSDPYQDAFGFGKIMSAAIPVYASNQIPHIVGVAAIDVFLYQLYNDGIDDSMIAQNFKNQEECYEGIKDNSTLQYLRCEAKGLTNCDALLTNISTTKNCASKITMDVFYAEVIDSRSDDTKCCGLTLAEFYKILFGSIGGFAILVVLVVLYKKGVFRLIYHKFCKPPKMKIDSQTESTTSDQKLFDPEHKYRDAQQDGMIIFHEPQFSL